MKKLPRRYYLLIFMVAFVGAITIREFDSKSFEIIKNSTAYAPENNNVFVDEYAVNKININTADVRLLGTLDGIGETMAKRIVDYRTKNGEFEVIQDIMKVDGIGEKKFESIKEDITVK